MTNAEIIEKALISLGLGWHTSRDVAEQARRGGWLMTTARARNVCRHLVRKNKAYMLVYGGRYSFEFKGA